MRTANLFFSLLYLMAALTAVVLFMQPGDWRDWLADGLLIGWVGYILAWVYQVVRNRR